MRNWPPFPTTESHQLLHELRVHQIELEMQNNELRRTQEELEASRARYFDLYDLAPVGYFTVSEPGVILEANLTFATLLGVARGALVQQPLSRFILPQAQDIHYRHHPLLFETGEPQVYEVRMLRADAAPFWARLEAAMLQEAESGSPLCRIVASNITENQQTETEKEKLEAQNLQLQKAESLGRMTGAIAHQLNNWIHVVMRNLELAMNELPWEAGPVE